MIFIRKWSLAPDGAFRLARKERASVGQVDSDTLLGPLVALVIIDFVNSLLSQVGPVDCLRVVVRDPRGFAGFGDGEALVVDETD